MKSGMCRICLIEDVCLQTTLNANLQKIFEKLTDTPFNMKDTKPLRVCYICSARLRNCHQLQVTCLKSEENFTQMLQNNALIQPLVHSNRLGIEHPINLSIVPEAPDNPDFEDRISYINIKVEPLDKSYNIQVKEELFEGQKESTMCRVCMTADVCVQTTLNANLQKIYEKLTDTLFNTEDKKPLRVCYICCARLQNCHQLQVTCLNSEEFLNQMLQNNELKIPLINTNRLGIEHPINLSIIPETLDNLDFEDRISHINIKVEPLDMPDDVQVKEEKFEDQEDIIQYTEAQDNFENDDGLSVQIVEAKDNLAPKTPGFNIKEEYRIQATKAAAGALFTKKLTLAVPNDNPETSNSSILDTEARPKQNQKAVKNIMDTDISNLEKNTVSDKINKSSNQYKCDTCEKSFSTRRSLYKHIVTHNSEKGYKCQTCDKSFSEHSHFIDHKRTHIGEKPYKCDICEKAFSTRNYLNKHIVIHTGEKPYKCEVCDKYFSQRGPYIRHSYLHTAERPYKCQECDKCFIHQSRFLKHSLIHSGEKQFKCEVCDRGFSQRSLLVKHNRIHSGEKPHKCHICGKSFINKHDLRTHCFIHTGEKPYKCQVCEKRFNQSSHYLRHSRTHTGEKPYKCGLCEKSFSSKTYLNGHILIHSGEKPFKCDLCEKYFSQQSDFVRHSRIHTGVKPYKCYICERSFSSKRYLNGHILTHSGEKPFKCEVCEKRFSQQSDYVRHNRIHTGEKPYKCDVCQKRFSDKSNLNAHVRCHR